MISHLRQKFHDNPAMIGSIITVSCVIVIVVVKAVALYLSHSAAVLSSFVDSLSDIGLSLMTLLAIRWSVKPADDDHRFGHGKIEGISALIQAAFLMGGGAFLLLEAFGRLLNPEVISHHALTLALMGFSVLLSLVISKVQHLGAEKSGSLAVKADALHYSTDTAINSGVFIVVMMDMVGWSTPWLDPLCALVVAGLMARAAYHIACSSFAMLMDQELPGDVRSRIIALIRSHPQCKGAHDVRTTIFGTKYMISFDMEVEGELSLRAAHHVAREVEQALLKEFENAEIMIHLDPFGDIEDSRHHMMQSLKSEANHDHSV